MRRSKKPASDDPLVRAELNETLGRCRTLFFGRQWRTRERSDWVSACLNPLYTTHPPASAEMGWLAGLAFGGWCWREAERGDRGPVERAVRAAHADVTRDKSIPATFAPALAAWKFLADGGKPGLGSPGATERDRLAFLDAAAERFWQTYGAGAGIDRDTGHEAFLRGVALNDVERLALGRAPLPYY